MIPPLTTNTAPLLPDPAPAPVKGEASLSTTTQPVPQTDKQTTSKPASTQDTVALSSTALSMSKALNSQHEQNATLQKDAVKQNEQPVVGDVRKPYTAAGKSYPPFMGNANELKALKESSPALYREILKMIVPPPLDISYADMQMLQNGKDQVSRT
jgi:hypothetical protein